MNWRRACLFALCLGTGAPVAGLAPPVAAHTEPPGRESKIQSLKDHIQEASVEEGRLLERMEEASARKAQLDAKVGDLDRQIATVQHDVDAAQGRLAALVAEQHAAEARLADTRRRLQVAKGELARSAIAAYTGQTEAAAYAEMLLGAANLGELAKRRTYLKATAGSQAEIVATAQRLRDEVQDGRDQLDRARRQAQGQRDVVAGQQAKLQSSRDAQAGARAEIAAQVVDLGEARAEVVARKDEFEAEMRALEQESNAIAATIRQHQASSASTDVADPQADAPDDGPPAASAGSRATGGSGGSGGSGSGAGRQSAAPRRSNGLVSPIPGAAIVSGYGQRVHPVYGTVRMHTGVDLAGSTGTPIRAAGDGVVVTASSMSGYGMTTVIDHGGSLATLYGHQSAILVSAGARVSQGQVIGRVGCTGTCTGPHLHYEVRVNGSPVNPAPYL